MGYWSSSNPVAFNLFKNVCLLNCRLLYSVNISVVVIIRKQSAVLPSLAMPLGRHGLNCFYVLTAAMTSELPITMSPYYLPTILLMFSEIHFPHPIKSELFKRWAWSLSNLRPFDVSPEVLGESLKSWIQPKGPWITCLLPLQFQLKILSSLFSRSQAHFLVSQCAIPLPGISSSSSHFQPLFTYSSFRSHTKLGLLDIYSYHTLYFSFAELITTVIS